MAKQEKIISVEKLLVDQKNFRIGEQPSQRDAIKAMIDEQGDGLANLAQHICENGLAPNKMLMVVASQADKGFYTVLDGNRRTTAIKLVVNPTLAQDTPLEKRFKDLNKSHSQKITKNLQCIELPADEAKNWIRVEHYKGQKGVAQEMWGSVATARADRADGKNSAVLDALDFVLAGNVLPDEARKIAESNEFNLTNLGRLLGSSDIKKKLGLEAGRRTIKCKKPKDWLLRILSEMVAVIATERLDGKKFGVGDIYNAEDQAAFADKIISKVGVASKNAVEWTVGQDTAPQIPPTKAKKVRAPKAVPAQASWERSSLIPAHYARKSFALTKLNNIYRELKLIDPHDRPIAVAMLFRALLELSVKKYCDDNGLGSGPIEMFTKQEIGDSILSVTAGGMNEWIVLAERPAMGEA